MATTVMSGGETPVHYSLPVGDETLPLNPLLGQRLELRFEGKIACLHCDRAIRKSFSQGYCYPCFASLARCDSCMVRPELCHYARGTCREPAWGERHCLIPHTVYLANSSAVKVGITRGLDPRSRWIDQGATQGLAIRIAGSRLESGLVEVALKRYVADRTNWRAMLRGAPEPVDLAVERDRLLSLHAESGAEALYGKPAEATDPLEIRYPVLEYPKVVRSHNLDKEARLEGTLMGIKGQYLLFDSAVINMRKYGGYNLTLEIQ
jgi:hypothetical protein